MRKPASSKPAQNAQPNVRHKSQGRLHKNFEISSRLKPYANRLRVSIAHLDLNNPVDELRLGEARTKMTNILIKKKISNEIAQRAVGQTLDIAADYQFDPLRIDQNMEGVSQSHKEHQRLIKQLRRLAITISGLPPLARGKLNRIVSAQEWVNFDTEMFHELIYAMLDALKKSSPAVIAAKAIVAIKELHRNSASSAASKIVSIAPPAILAGAVRNVVGICVARLRQVEVISSSGEVNWLIDGFGRECLPAIDFAHVDLS